MENLPLYISILFAFTTILTIWFFYKAAKNSATVLIAVFLWLLVQSILALKGFYTITTKVPPRFILLVLPPLILITVLFITKRGKHFIDGLDIRLLTILHSIRIPVEIVLFNLYLYKMIPGIMTFEGNNFDILSGISALIIYYIVFIKKKANKKLLLAWNCICLALLINIVVTAILSAPFVFQQFAFDQPNIALLYFPYIFLPCCIVPIVLLSHLAAIRQLLKRP